MAGVGRKNHMPKPKSQSKKPSRSRWTEREARRASRGCAWRRASQLHALRQPSSQRAELRASATSRSRCLRGTRQRPTRPLDAAATGAAATPARRAQDDATTPSVSGLLSKLPRPPIEPPLTQPMQFRVCAHRESARRALREHATRFGLRPISAFRFLRHCCLRRPPSPSEPANSADFRPHAQAIWCAGSARFRIGDLDRRKTGGTPELQGRGISFRCSGGDLTFTFYDSIAAPQEQGVVIQAPFSRLQSRSGQYLCRGYDELAGQRSDSSAKLSDSEERHHVC